MELKTKENLKNDYWSKFLRTGRIEDYILFKKLDELDTEFSKLGVNYDISKQKEDERDNNKD